MLKMRGSFIATEIFSKKMNEKCIKLTNENVFQVEQLQAFKVQFQTEFQLLNEP